MAMIAKTFRKESAMSRTTAVTFGFSDELDFLLNIYRVLHRKDAYQ
jgi:hypothetical protein